MTSLIEIRNGRPPRPSRFSPAILAESAGAATRPAPGVVVKCDCQASLTLQAAIANFLALGNSPDDIAIMVSRAQQATTPLPGQRCLPGFEPPIFDQLPPGMIDVPTAAQKYELKPHNIRDWINAGYIDIAGYLKRPGSKMPLVRETELIHHKKSRRPRGRPRSRK